MQLSVLGLFKIVFENYGNFKYPWNVYINMDILLIRASVFLHVVQVLFRIKQLFKSITWRSIPRLENCEWLGVWNFTGKYLEQWVPPVYWNFTPEQGHNPEELLKYLEKVCFQLGNSREAQLTATCWA